MIIMMFRTNAYKEMILPNLDNTDYRIFVDKKLFDVFPFIRKREVRVEPHRLSQQRVEDAVEPVFPAGGSQLEVEVFASLLPEGVSNKLGGCPVVAGLALFLLVSILNILAIRKKVISLWNRKEK